jgi:hypothetical protein
MCTDPEVLLRVGGTASSFVGGQTFVSQASRVTS